MDFWRSEAYSKFFDHLESKGGFYYEVRCQLFSNDVDGSSHLYSAGEMHQYIALPRRYLLVEIKYTSSMILATVIRPFSTVRKVTTG